MYAVAKNRENAGSTRDTSIDYYLLTLVSLAVAARVKPEPKPDRSLALLPYELHHYLPSE